MGHAKQTKASKIVNTLEKLILEGKLEQGSFLPSQSELAVRFRTSSRPVREALKLLEEKNLVRTAQGRKAQICFLPASLLSRHSLQHKMTRNLIQVCAAILVSAARELSRSSARRPSIEKMREHCAAMERAREANGKESLSQGLEMGNLFFRTLAQSCDNRILLAIYDNVMPLLFKSIRELHFTAKEMEKPVGFCVSLTDALDAGQSDLSVALMLIMFNTLESKILKKIPESGEALAWWLPS